MRTLLTTLLAAALAHAAAAAEMDSHYAAAGGTTYVITNGQAGSADSFSRNQSRPDGAKASDSSVQPHASAAASGSSAMGAAGPRVAAQASSQSQAGSGANAYGQGSYSGWLTVNDPTGATLPTVATVEVAVAGTLNGDGAGYFLGTNAGGTGSPGQGGGAWGDLGFGDTLAESGGAISGALFSDIALAPDGVGLGGQFDLVAAAMAGGEEGSGGLADFVAEVLTVRFPEFGGQTAAELGLSLNWRPADAAWVMPNDLSGFGPQSAKAPEPAALAAWGLLAAAGLAARRRAARKARRVAAG